MKMFSRSVAFFCGTCLFFAGFTSAQQITYTRLLNNGNIQIRQMQSNGTGDREVDFGLNRATMPTWSRDGSRLSVTAFRRNRVTNRTWNVYERRPGDGRVRQLTNLRDVIDPNRNSASYTFPWYKAYSPNNRFMAIFSLTQSGGGGGGVAEVPVLEIYSLRNNANPILVHVDKTKNGRHHGGEGVDWSPARNLLAAPLQTGTPFQNSSGSGDTTAIFLIPPELTSVQNGQARQITFPRADASIQTGVMWTEHDYAPRFSPTGGALVYVRSFQAHSLLTSLNPDPNIQSLRVLNMNTGADREIRRFPQGTYITTVDWSPNGTRLVFDLAVQDRNAVVGPLQQADQRTNQIYVMDANGNNLQQLRGNRNGNPSWR